MRIVSWFSCGACSAVATKLTVDYFGPENVNVVYCDTGGEHPDNMRFLMDCEQWFGTDIEILKSDKYESHWDVFDKTNFIKGPQGARCTVELKKKLRMGYEDLNDLQIFGYSHDNSDQRRAERFENSFPEYVFDFPLIEKQITKATAKGILQKACIELPAMYHLGYANNNCIGCPKGGMGYWNAIRRDFPEDFERMAQQEDRLGFTLFDVPLRELDPDRGNLKSDTPRCDFVCQSLDV